MGHFMDDQEIEGHAVRQGGGSSAALRRENEELRVDVGRLKADVAALRATIERFAACRARLDCLVRGERLEMHWQSEIARRDAEIAELRARLEKASDITDPSSEGGWD